MNSFQIMIKHIGCCTRQPLINFLKIVDGIVRFISFANPELPEEIG
jgi:hypothetical protein